MNSTGTQASTGKTAGFRLLAAALVFFSLLILLLSGQAQEDPASKIVPSPSELTPEEEALFSDTPFDNTDDTEGELARPLRTEGSILENLGQPVPTFERLSPNQSSDCSELQAAESAWARFAPGSWILTRTAGTTVQFGKNLKSVTETRLTLVEITKDSYLLKREVSIKMGKRTHAKPPEFVKYNFFDIPVDDQTVSESLPPQSLQIGPRVVPCRVRRFTRTTPQMIEMTTIWFSTVQAPYIFQSQTETYLPSKTGGQIGKLLRQSVMTLPRAVVNTFMGNDANLWRTEIIEKTADSIARTQQFHSAQIPGGIKKEIMVENDNGGNVIYRSTMDVLDFHVK